MNNYEILVIAENALSDEEKQKAIGSVVALIEKVGGKTEEPDVWGTRKYAYPINYKTEGYYFCIRFTADDKAPQAIGAKLNIDKNIVRYMITAR